MRSEQLGLYTIGAKMSSTFLRILKHFWRPFYSAPRVDKRVVMIWVQESGQG